MTSSTVRSGTILMMIGALFVGITCPVPLFAQGTWTTKASMPTARSAALGSVNGKVYAIGGQIGFSVVGTVEAYDPATDTWTTKSPMPTARHSLGIAVASGMLYAIGGCTTFDCSGIVGTVEVYDPIADSWTTKAPMPTARRSFGISVIDGVVYTLGGLQGPGSGFTDTNEAYDTATNTWSTKSVMPAPVPVSAAVFNELLYAIGNTSCCAGASNSVYDPSTDTWTTKTPPPVATGIASSYGTAAIGSRIYDAGLGPTCNALLAYDPIGDAWSPAAPQPVPCAGAGWGVTASNGALYEVGGDSSGQANQAFTPFAAAIQPPLRADGSSVFNSKRGVVPVKFTLAELGSPTCDLLPATILVLRTSGGSPGPVNEDVFVTASDGGSNFRIDTANCQYVYNLGTKSLGPGTYEVQINIGGISVGSAVFGLE